MARDEGIIENAEGEYPLRFACSFYSDLLIRLNRDEWDCFDQRGLAANGTVNEILGSMTKTRYLPALDRRNGAKIRKVDAIPHLFLTQRGYHESGAVFHIHWRNASAAEIEAALHIRHDLNRVVRHRDSSDE